MSSPSILGNLGHAVSLVRAFSTSTARAFVRTSDTGTVVLNGVQVDLGRLLHQGATGGKPFDATVHVRKGGPPAWKSVQVSVPLELVYHTSGLNTFVVVAHQQRSATTGAGSTWAAIKTDTFRFKMGTDTDATFHTGCRSAANLQAVQRYYRANVTFQFRKATDTAAKDTTTAQEMVCNSPVYEFSAVEAPQVSVPFKVS